MSESRIQTTHAGSLPRPAELVQLYARRAHGQPIDEAELARAADAATRWVVPKQLEAGIDLVNNGEQTREAFFLYVQRRMSGFAAGGRRPPLGDVARYPAFAEMRARLTEQLTAVSNFVLPRVVDEVHYLDDSIIAEECADFAAVLAENGLATTRGFLCAPSPGIIAAAIRDEHYGDEDAYLAALTSALRTEYKAVTDAGFHLQLDGPDLALERHITYADRPLADFQDFVARVIARLNEGLEGIPAEAVRLHVCWGNYEGPHDLDVPLADILPLLYEAKVGALVLPFANPRHAHEYRVFEVQPLPESMALFAGVIDTTTNFVEHPEVVADRLENLARALGGPERLGAATDCGFDTSAGFGRVAEDVVWAKLASMCEGARIAEARLGG